MSLLLDALKKAALERQQASKDSVPTGDPETVDDAMSLPKAKTTENEIGELPAPDDLEQLQALETPPPSLLADLDMALSEAFLDQDVSDGSGKTPAQALDAELLDDALPEASVSGANLSDGDLCDTPLRPQGDTQEMLDVAGREVSLNPDEGNPEHDEQSEPGALVVAPLLCPDLAVEPEPEPEPELELELSDLAINEDEETLEDADSSFEASYLEAIAQRDQAAVPAAANASTSSRDAVARETSREAAPDPLASVIENSELVQRVLRKELSGGDGAIREQSVRMAKQSSSIGKLESPSQEEALAALMQANGRSSWGPLIKACIASLCLAVSAGILYLLIPNEPIKPYQARQTTVSPDGQDGISAVIRSDELMAGLSHAVDDEEQASLDHSGQLENTLVSGDPPPSEEMLDDTHANAVGQDNTDMAREDAFVESSAADVTAIEKTANNMVTDAHTPVLTQNPHSEPHNEALGQSFDNPKQTKRETNDGTAATRVILEPFALQSQPHKIEPASSKRSARSSLPESGTTHSNTSVEDNADDWRFHQAQAQVRGGYIDFKRGYYRAAARHYQRALDLEPNNKDAHLGLAALAQISGSLTEALFRYNRVLQDWPEDEVARAGLSSLSYGRHGVSLETELKLLLEKYPNSPHLSFVLGNVYAQRSAWRVAQKYYFIAWSGDSDNSNYLYNLAISLDHLGERSAAIEFYEKLLRMERTKSDLYSVEAVRDRLTHLSAGQAAGDS